MSSSAWRHRRGELGAAYAILILYVPLLMITHVASVRLLARRGTKTAACFSTQAAA